MADWAVRLGLYVAVCASAGLVHGATRASSPSGIVRHAIRETVKLGGGIALLCGSIWVLLQVVQS